MDFEHKSRICDLIEAVVAADGVITSEEREYVARLTQKLRLPIRDEVTSANALDVGPTTAMLRDFPPEVGMRIVALLVDAAVVDGRVEPEERALLLAAAATLGIDAVALEERIAQRLAAGVA